MSLTSQGVDPQPSLAWQFNGTTTDYMTGLTATVNGAVSYSTGKYDKSIVIINDVTLSTGSNSISRTFTTSFAIDNGLTVAFWFKPYQIGTATQTLLQGGGTAGGSTIIFNMNGTTGTVSMWFKDASYHTITSSSAISVNTWNHLCLSVGSGNVAAYLNGISQGTTTYTPSGSVFTDFRLGAYGTGLGTPSTGEYDDLRVYNTALSAAQVKSVYSQGGALASSFRVMPQPSLAWSFNGTVTDYVTGLAPANYLGASSNAITYANAAIYAPGKYSQSINVYNTSNTFYLNTLQYRLPSAIGPPYSISFWAKQNTIWVPGNGSFSSLMLRNISSPVNSFSLKLVSFSIGNSSTAFNVLDINNNASSFSYYLTGGIGNWFFVCLSVLPQTATLYFWSPSYTSIQSNTVTTANTWAICGTDIATAISGYTETNITNQPFNGLIDDLRVYNTALSAAQVQSIYNAQGMPSRGVQVRAVQPLLLGNATILYRGAPTGNTAFNCSGPYATVTNFLKLGTSSPVNFNYNSSNLFCEFWWYTSNTSLTNLSSPISLGSLTTNSTSYRVGIRRNSGFSINFSSAAANSTPLSATTWYHFAFSVDSTNKNLYVFVNGYGGTPTSYTGTLSYNASHEVSIGYSNALAMNYYYDQTIKDMRVIKDGLVPTINFIPEAAPWAYGSSPSYVVGGTNVLGLAAQYMSPMPMTGTPLFSQLSTAVTSSAVGAFSLRAVNGTTAKVVSIQSHPIVQWPPIAMTSNATVVSAQVYGNGTYYSTELSGQSNTSSLASFKVFDNNINTYYEQLYTGSNYYDYNLGTLLDTTKTTTVSGASAAGWWIQIQLPTTIVLRSYTLVGRQDGGFWNTRNPTTFWVAGSNDGTTWSNVHFQSQISYGQSGTTINVPSTSNSLPYSYYRLIVNVIGNAGVAGNHSTLNIASWNLNGDGPSYVSGSATDFYADRLGNLLTAPVTGQTLANWLGGATGYVVTWYDQSGAGNHATQATAANQPVIQRATKGPGYSVLFNGTTNYLTGMSYTVLNNTNYSFSVIERRNSSAVLMVIGSGSSGSPDTRLHFGYKTSTSVRFGQYNDDMDINPYPAYAGASEPLHYWIGTESSTTGRFIYENGTVAKSDATKTILLASLSGNFTIGNGSGGYYSGEIYEVLVFTSSLYDLNTTGGLITQIYQNQLSYTGT